MGETKIELLEATHPDSAIAKFLEKKGEGIHHLAFEVEDIHQAMEKMKNEGFILLNQEPKKVPIINLSAFYIQNLPTEYSSNYAKVLNHD